MSAQVILWGYLYTSLQHHPLTTPIHCNHTHRFLSPTRHTCLLLTTPTSHTHKFHPLSTIVIHTSVIHTLKRSMDDNCGKLSAIFKHVSWLWWCISVLCDPCKWEWMSLRWQVVVLRCLSSDNYKPVQLYNHRDTIYPMEGVGLPIPQNDNVFAYLWIHG